MHQAFLKLFFSSKSGEACSYPCDYNLFLAGSSIAHNKRNLFVSTEDFSVIGLMGSGGVDKLYAYLSQWDTVTIIVYYRHFFSFIGSKYNQRMKNKSIERGHYKTIQEYMSLDQQSDDSKYTLKLVQRLQRKFDNIVVVNMHDRSPVDSFFCHAVPFFEKTCNAIRSEERQDVMNSSENLHHVHLLAGAVKAGLLSREKASELSVQKSVHRKVREIESLPSNKNVLKMKCLSSKTLQDLWQRSITYKRTLLPQF